MPEKKSIHYVVALSEEISGYYDVGPVHVNAASAEEAAQEGLVEIANNAGMAFDELEGYEVGVAPNSAVTYFRIDTATKFSLTKLNR